ncbi:DNA binding protein [Aureococcus anophagefferens]|nr:DNA binding protein [Aureococcus anophagefferens]
MAGGRPAAGADDGGGGATAARRRLPYAAALCAFALAGGAAVRLQRPLGLGSPRRRRGPRAARRPRRGGPRRATAGESWRGAPPRLDRDGGGGDGGPLPLDEIEVASTEAPTLAPSNCSLSYSEFAESLETEVYGSCPWHAAAATAGEQMWFEDCLAVLNGTIAQCAFQGCATCGHYATCGDLEASPAPYADCVTCPDGYEVDVVYEDCSGACVLEGFAVNPAATCVCAAEMSAALLFEDGAVGAATCAPSVAPTAFDGSTDVTYFATSAVALDGITPDAITYDAGAVADIEAALVIALAPYVNGSAFVTSLTASSAIASTLIGFDFYHWASVAGDAGDAALANASAAFASDYYDAATTAVDVGALEDALAAAATTATVKAATVDVMTSLEALDTTTVTWARGQDLETDSTADVATALEVVVSSALVFSGVDSDTFNDDVDAVAEFKDVIAALWPNVTADYVYEVSASLDGGLTSIAYSFYDYFWLASNATADDAAAADAAYVAAYVATVVEAATSGDLQTLVDDATAGRRRLSLLNGGSGPTAAPTSLPTSLPPTPPPTYEPTYNPSYAPSTYEPSSMPTETPTYAPSYVPTDGACDADYCWADETVAEFGCSDNTHVFPVQIMRLSDDDARYSVLELEYEEGNYDLMYDIEYFDGHINAAAMFVTASEDAFFSFASFGGYLCRFDESHAVCFATPLASDSPNAAAIIGNTYYYAKNFGNNIQNSHIYWVGDIHTDRPDFHDGHEFTMSPELYKSSVLDFVAVEEYGAEMIVDMYDEDGTYLVGIALGYEVVVVHVNRATKKPDKYAVLDAVVDWGDADDHSDDDNSFGAAFAYKLLRHADLYASYRLFFASNEGYGIMELATGFEIPDDCWNEGDDVENHAKCDATVALNYLGPSEPTHYNDGLNCPNGDFVLAPTAAPTEEPCTGRLCWDDVAVDEFDCETNYNPVQVMRYDDASLYGAYELNFDDGAYHLLYELDYFDGHINAVALYDGGKKGYYAMGSFGGYLCRFDAAAKVCFDDALAFSSPNVGAIVDKRYYYAKNLGEADDNGEIFWVDLIHTDEPEFYADSAFAVAPSLYDGAVDFDGFDPADDDTGGFGASFVYNADGDTKIYFTANSGQGLFELALPVAVPDSCWNAGFDTDAHGVCDVVVGIRRVSASAPTNYNDGMNCPEFFEAAPSTEPTPEPTPEPTRRADARAHDAAGADADAEPEPIQVLKYDGADAYTVRELDIDTGVYSEVEDLSWFDGHINAAAIFTGGDPTDLGSSNYAMASFGGYLCRFDASSKVCFDTPLEYESPNVGAIVGTNYYYAKNVGRDGGEGFYYVGEINGDAPFFYEDATFGVSEDLYTGAVLDVAAVEEHDGDTKVIDGEGGRGYLVGLGGAYELLVVRLGEETGEPEAYAVLESSVDWGDDLEFYDDGETSFGAAYAYLDIVGSEYATRAFFSSNTGAGMFELEFPIYVPKTCWNEGFSYDDHEVCSNTVSLAYVGPSEATSSNDGMNCPISLDLTSGVPTHPSPAPSAPPSTPPTPYPSLGPDACGDGEVLTSLRFFPDVADWTGVTITAYNATSGPTSANALDVDAFVAAGTDRVYKCAEATSCVLLEFAFPDAATAGDLAYEATAPDEEVYVNFEYGEAVQYFSYCLEDGAIARAHVGPDGVPPADAPPSAPPTGAPAPRPTRPRRRRRRRPRRRRADGRAVDGRAVRAAVALSSEAPTTYAPSTEAPTRSPIVSAPPTATFLPTAAPTYTVAPSAAPTLSCPEGGQWVLSTTGISCATECADRYTRTSNAIHDAVVSEVDTVNEVSALVDDLSGGLIPRRAP